MPTLTPRFRPSLRMESLEDRSLWSVGFLQPQSPPLLPSVTQRAELLQPYPTPLFPFSTVTATLVWSDGVVSDGVVSVDNNGVLTVQTSRSLDPTQSYTVALTIPATDTTDSITLQIIVQPLSVQLNNPNGLTSQQIPPNHVFGGVTASPPSPIVVIPTGPIVSIDPVQIVNLVTGLAAHAKPPVATPTAPPPVKPPEPTPPATPVPVVITIRIEPPLSRPSAQSQYEAGTYRVEVQVSPSANWQQPTADPQMFLSPIRTLPPAPLLHVGTMPDVVEVAILQGQPLTKKSVDRVVVNPPRIEQVSEFTVLEPVELRQVIPANASQDTVVMAGVALSDAILVRFAAEALPSEPIAQPDEFRASYFPFSRWLSFAVLTSVAVRTWLVPSKRKLTDYQL